MLCRADVTFSWPQDCEPAIGFKAPSTRIIGGASTVMWRSDPLVINTFCRASSRSGSGLRFGSRRDSYAGLVTGGPACGGGKSAGDVPAVDIGGASVFG